LARRPPGISRRTGKPNAVSDVNPAVLRRFEDDYDRQTNGRSQS
jgi:hypothetical protein